jgi:hypothetical protein
MVAVEGSRCEHPARCSPNVTEVKPGRISQATITTRPRLPRSAAAGTPVGLLSDVRPDERLKLTRPLRGRAA